MMRIRVSDFRPTLAVKWNIFGKLVVPVDLAESRPVQEHGAVPKWPEGQAAFVDLMMAEDAHQSKLRVWIPSIAE